MLRRAAIISTDVVFNVGLQYNNRVVGAGTGVSHEGQGPSCKLRVVSVYVTDHLAKDFS